jgi:hypothetical protein
MGKDRITFCVGAKLLLVAILFTVIPACDDGRLERVPIAGTVLIDGKPVQHGIVRFFPAAGRPSSGNLDENGRFVLTCFKEGDGTVLGHHRVAIFGYEQLNAKQTRWEVPRSYADPSTSGIEQDITGPKDDIVINLTWGNGKPFIIESAVDESLEHRGN